MFTTTSLEGPDGHSLRLWTDAVDGASEGVLLVHGSPFGFRAGFAPGSDDREFWADAIADAGRSVFGIDIRGYGDSERPPAMEAPPDEHPPVAPATEAARDVAAALEHVRSHVETVHLVGVSWGTVVCGALFAEETEEAPSVESLVLYGPVYEVPDSDPEDFDPDDPPAAYRHVTKAEMRDQWDGPLFETIWAAAHDSTQQVADADEPTLRVPNGSLLDRRAAARGEPVYDPADIDVPTLVVRGAQDATSVRADALAIFDGLGATHAEYLEIDGATHFLLVEPKRHTLYEVANGFFGRTGGR